MAGVIDDHIRYRVAGLLAQANIRTVVMVAVPGSSDDNSKTAAALQMSRAGVQTHLINGGDVESGGVDFLLAGAGRSVSQSFNIGVHSWAGGGTSGFHLRNNPHNNNQLVPFLNDYRSIGIPDSFYFFTIGFRPADMHDMTAAELNQHAVFKQATGPTPPGPMPPGPTPPAKELTVVGVWTEFQQDGRRKTITIKQDGSFTEIGFNGSPFSSRASLNGNVLELRGNDNSVERLNVTVTPTPINFPGQRFRWGR